MKSVLTLIIIFTIVFSTPLVNAQTVTNNDQALRAQIEMLLQLIAKLQAQLAAQKSADIAVSTTTSEEWSFDRTKEAEFYASLSSDGEEYSDDDPANLFVVQGGNLLKDFVTPPSTSNSIENQVWSLFKEMAGADFIDQYVLEFATYDSKDNPIVAFVHYFHSDDPQWWMYREAEHVDKLNYSEHTPGWGLGVNVAGAGFTDKKWADYTIANLIHEYGHLLTLSGTQIYHDIRIAPICDHQKHTYFVPGDSGGCSMKNSYLNTFVQMFWSKSDLEEATYALKNGTTEEFYNKHKDDFVSEYAASSPAEDMAETFTDFVLQKKPTDEVSVRNKKILFYYNYPELITIRAHIRSVIEKYYK